MSARFPISPLRAIVACGLLASVVVSETPAGAQQGFYSGNRLLELCRNRGGDSPDFAVCMGYVVGLADAMSATRAILGFSACVPEGVTVGQVADVVTQWLERNPQQRHLLARGLVAWALSDAFPCQQ